jgi:DNA-binding beta-propeller fold protein YncE/phospholipase C
MRRLFESPAFISLFCGLIVAYSNTATLVSQEPDKPSQPGGESAVDASLLPSGEVIRPAGETIAYYGRPIDIASFPAKSLLFVKDRSSLLVIDAVKFEIRQSIELKGGASINGITVLKDGKVLVSNAQNQLQSFQANDDGLYELKRKVEFASSSYPCGVCVNQAESRAFVALSKRNSVAVVDLETFTLVREIEVGVAPFDVALSNDEAKLVVSNIGGRRPEEGEATAPSAGTEVVVDARGIAATGSVSVIDMQENQLLQSIRVGLQPSVLRVHKSEVLVCNTNQDSLSSISLDDFKSREIVVKPDLQYPFGSMPNGLALNLDGSRLFVSLAGNNAVAVFEPLDGSWQLRGLIPTAWYPAGCTVAGEYLYITNTKGFGSRTPRREENKGLNSHDHQGVVQRVALEAIENKVTLKAWTDQVLQRSTLLGETRVAETVTAKIEAAGGLVKPIPIPKRLGEPSLFKHVIYVIKENRTFDQVFGDMKEARAEPSLCVFPEKFTPNHHALAKRFGILDNYYCNGVLSADGHSWATEGNVTPYLERAFGGFTRSYTFGDDPITYSASGFLWDRILSAGLSFRNYGELDYAKIQDGGDYQKVWSRYQAGEKEVFTQQVGIERLRRYTCPDYPGWNMAIPDVLRVDRFLEEFRQFEEKGGLPNLCLVYLPQDHLGGGVTSGAHMADNDLALGRLVEAVSKSKYWESTVIFVNEDDPQNGYDHIDGHRSLCLVVSPYSKPGVNHQFYNQTSVLRTILHIFGLPPLNQKDAASPLMTACFGDVADNRAPFQALPAAIPLNEKPGAPDKQSAIEKKWREILATVPIERTGMKTPVDEDNLNRFVWHEQMGWTTPYPREVAGSHGKGLTEIQLKIDEEEDED